MRSPHGAEGRRVALFDGEAVDGFSRRLKRLLVATEVLQVFGVKPQSEVLLNVGLGGGSGSGHGEGLNSDYSIIV
ncbi:hypothetical protein NIES30_25780 [Phormidium tenue NIES-30]|uniref:Uncharacterized protein n=1 Tax=Phormidium tenue NIES-30 TaxID=549789 RepID=A0A1U7IXK6_9CYAN|nr:hypothetical protein NIES30_25780 [Phormidium tenue NIES-30]